MRYLLFRGVSMLPMLRQGKDSVELSPLPEKLKKYDLHVYRRKNGQYVMHRVVEVKEDHYICLGDNTEDFEHILYEDMLGIVTAFKRKDKFIAVTNRFKSCAGGDVLKGTWDLDGTTMYQFEGDGEGSMILPYNTYTFQYTIDEKKQTVSIDFDDEKANDYTYNYKISEDKLILFGSEGKESFEFVFTKISDK